MDKIKTKTYPHVTGIRGDEGESPTALAVTAVLDPSPHYPDEGRIIMGSPTRPDRPVPDFLSCVDGCSMSVAAAEDLIDILGRAVSDIRAATSTSKVDVRPFVEQLDGFQRIGRMDAAGRRSLWMRVTRGIGGIDPSIELRAGRDGNDAGVVIDPSNPQYGPLTDVLCAARFAAEWEDRGGNGLDPMGIERFGFEDPDDDVRPIDDNLVVVYRIRLKDLSRWKEPQHFRLIVRPRSHFALQHRVDGSDIIEGDAYYWQPALHMHCGVTADYVMSVILQQIAFRFMMLGSGLPRVDAKLNVQLVDLGEYTLNPEGEPYPTSVRR